MTSPELAKVIEHLRGLAGLLDQRLHRRRFGPTRLASGAHCNCHDFNLSVGGIDPRVPDYNSFYILALTNLANDDTADANIINAAASRK